VKDFRELKAWGKAHEMTLKSYLSYLNEKDYSSVNRQLLEMKRMLVALTIKGPRRWESWMRFAQLPSANCQLLEPAC